MKKRMCIILILCYTCSSSEDSHNTDQGSTLEVSVISDATTVSIDQIVTLTATANEPINEISFSTDGGATFPISSGGNLGTTANLYFAFDTLGSKSVIFRVENSAGDMVDTTVDVDVERGDAVQLQSLQLNSFFDMGNTWDSEFPTTDPNHLADVFFVILKPTLNVLTGTRNSITSSSLWYRSPTRDNETNLNWDLQNEELYINPTEVLTYIAFADDDGVHDIGSSAFGDLMMGTDERLIPFGEYYIAQPNNFTVTEADIDLEYTIGLDW